MTTREKILDVLEKILKDKEYKDGYPKIVLRCPATEDGEHKLHNALYNVDYVINNYFPKLAEKYEVVGTTNGAMDEPSDVIDFDDCSDGMFYADVVNASDFDGEYVIGGNYYSSLEEVNDPEYISMSVKNSLIIDVDIFNTICDELYTEALYNKTIDKLFNTDNYEYSFSADAKIVKSVCDKVNDYINNNGSVVGTIDQSKIKTDELNKYPDDATIDVTFYIEEQTIDNITILNYYCKFKKYDWRETLESYFEEKEKQEKEGNIMKNNKEAKREIILIDTEFLDNQLEAGNETIEVDEIRKIAEEHMPDGSGVLIKEAYSNKEVEELVKMINNGVDDESTAPAPANTTMLPEIERIYYNKTKKTVNIFWSNGTETKVITADGDKFSLTAGIKECFIKYACGNNFDGVQKRIEDAKKKAVLTASKEKKNKKSKVERLVDEVANANLTSDEKDDFVIALDKVINTETKTVKQNKKGSK